MYGQFHQPFHESDALGFEAGHFGEMTRGQLTDLWKALVAGQDIDNPGTAAGQGFPFRVEFLDNMLRYISFRARDVKFFTSLIKEQALNTVIEYNLFEEYGEESGGFIAEGDLPEEHDLTLSRNYATVKYLATLRRVTHPMQLIRPAHGDVIRRSAEAGTLWLLRAAERACFFGDSAVVAEEWDGCQAQIEAAVTSGFSPNGVVDMRGKMLDEDQLNETIGEVVAHPNYGYPTTLHYSVQAHQNFAKQFYPKERVPIATNTIVGGFKMPDFQSSILDYPVMLSPNVFIREGETPVTAGLGNTAKRPAAPTVTAQPTSPAASGGEVSQFAVDDEGTYIYKVVAVNRYGKSTPVELTGVAVSAGDVVKFTVQHGTGTTGYEIFRTDADGAATTAKFIVRVAKGAAATLTYTDENNDLPGTGKGFLLQQNREALSFYLLAPMMMYRLADIDLSRRWAQLLYGTLILNAVRKHRMFKNLGNTLP